MTQEEKAKAYDEAIERVKIHRFSSNIAEIKLMEQIFLELKESEDERIRKAIIDIVKSQKEQQCHIDSTIYDEMLTWLEKAR